MFGEEEKKINNTDKKWNLASQSKHLRLMLVPKKGPRVPCRAAAAVILKLVLARMSQNRTPAENATALEASVTVNK